MKTIETIQGGIDRVARAGGVTEGQSAAAVAAAISLTDNQTVLDTVSDAAPATAKPRTAVQIANDKVLEVGKRGTPALTGTAVQVGAGLIAQGAAAQVVLDLVGINAAIKLVSSGGGVDDAIGDYVFDNLSGGGYVSLIHTAATVFHLYKNLAGTGCEIRSGIRLYWSKAGTIDGIYTADGVNATLPLTMTLTGV
jgi:hypothetical protein